MDNPVLNKLYRHVIGNAKWINIHRNCTFLVSYWDLLMGQNLNERLTLNVKYISWKINFNLRYVCRDDVNLLSAYTDIGFILGLCWWEQVDILLLKDVGWEFMAHGPNSLTLMPLPDITCIASLMDIQGVFGPSTRNEKWKRRLLQALKKQ